MRGLGRSICVLGAIAALGACGDSGGDEVDAAGSIDAPAPPDAAMVDAPPPPDSGPADADLTPDTLPPPDGRPCDTSGSTGRFQLAWSILEGGSPATCSDVGATTVRVRSTRDCEIGFEYTEPHVCATGGGMTARLPLGLYFVVVELLDADDNVLATSPSQIALLITDGAVFDLGDFAFAF